MPGSTDHFDILVLGSGEAGKYIAWTLASAGKTTAVVERRYVGGSCPNVACLPSKNFVHTAKVAHYASQAAAFGLPVAEGAIDMEVVRGRKRAMVDGLVEMHQGRFAQTGAALVMGEGRFVDAHTLQVTDADGATRMLTAETIVVSTGSRATIGEIPGLREAEPLTHIEMLETCELPEHLIVLGGGYIGLEFAQAMRRLGSAVTVVERNARVLHREDEDVSGLLTKVLEREGVRFLTGATVEAVGGKSGGGVTVEVSLGGSQMQLKGSHLLVAAGRTPNTEGIGLDVLGVKLTESGHIAVDEHLRTSAPHVFAVGDCAGSPHFTHIAFDDYRIVRNQLTGGAARTTTARQVPFCLFTDPEFARIGLSETDARWQGVGYRLARLPMAAVLRTRTMGETEGFLKALIADDDSILGFTAVGVGVGELLAPVQLAMSAGLPYSALRDLIVTHPTLTEGLVYLFSSPLTRV